MSPLDRLAQLRAAPGPVQVVGYSPAELAERALAEALAAARALGRLWRRRASRARRVEALARMGVHVPTEAESRSIVDALIKTTLAGGFRIVERPGLVGGRGPRQCRPVDDHEPFPLTRRIPSSSHGERRSD